MKNTNDIFNRIPQIFSNYEEACKAALFDYRRETRRNFSDYSEQGKANILTVARNTAAAVIEDADRRFTADLKGEVAALRTALSSPIVSGTRAEVVEELKIRRDFNIPMTAGEARQLIGKAGGDMLLVQAIAAVGKDSGLRIDMPSPADYEKDLAKLEAMTATGAGRFVPADYLHEATEIMGVRSEQALMHAGGWNSLKSALPDMAARWSRGVVPVVVDHDEDTPADGEDTPADGEDWRAELAAEMAAKQAEKADIAHSMTMGDQIAERVTAQRSASTSASKATLAAYGIGN